MVDIDDDDIGARGCCWYCCCCDAKTPCGSSPPTRWTRTAAGCRARANRVNQVLGELESFVMVDLWLLLGEGVGAVQHCPIASSRFKSEPRGLPNRSFL